MLLLSSVPRLTLDYDTGNCALALSMLDYIPALLQLYRPIGVRLASSFFPLYIYFPQV
jgi:hypothetical protein